MMSTEHPITPPPELVEQWVRSSRYTEGMLYPEGYKQQETRLATQAARWGSDQELEACINEIYKGVGLRHVDYSSNRESLCSDLRAARRPQPPSLKEQALQGLDYSLNGGYITPEAAATIRRALESLPD